MIKLEEIRVDLKEVRYYFSRKEFMDKAFIEVTTNDTLDKVRQYNSLIRSAPPRLFDVYVSLYANNLTQEALAHESGYTPRYICMLNKRLLLFLRSKLAEK